MGAAIYSWIKTGELKSQGSSISEGIGQGRVTGNLDGAQIDDAFQIPDTRDAARPLRPAAKRGPAARRLERDQRRRRDPPRAALGPGKTIVTVLADSGSRYQSKLFNPEFLRAKDLPLPPWLVSLSRVARSAAESFL